MPVSQSTDAPHAAPTPISLSEFLASLAASTPELPGALCRGQHELFDATYITGRGAPAKDVRHARDTATELCAQCPALTECTTWVSTLAPEQQPLGITAGQLRNPHRASAKDRRAARDQRITELRAEGLSAIEIAAVTGTGKSTVFRLLADLEPAQPQHDTTQHGEWGSTSLEA